MEESKHERIVKKAMTMNREFVYQVNELFDVSDVEVNSRVILKMQDGIMFSMEYLEDLFSKEKYPTNMTQTNIIDSVVRLSHTAFDFSTHAIEKYYFDQVHFSNSFRIVVENLVSSLHHKGKTKAELFRDNSIHIKMVKRYFACVSNSFRELVMDEPLDKIIKAFKGFNNANVMNESKCSHIREAIIEGYELVLKYLHLIPVHLLDSLVSIYECSNHYYYEEDDPSSSSRLKKILPIINILFMRFLFSPEILD